VGLGACCEIGKDPSAPDLAPGADLPLCSPQVLSIQNICALPGLRPHQSQPGFTRGSTSVPPLPRDVLHRPPIAHAHRW
jgi:hypothetical protein